MKFTVWAVGLYYFNARWYDAGTGRFVSKDPIEDGLAWYVYCNNNPLVFVDLNGLEISPYQKVESNYRKAREYLTSYSPTARKLFNDLDKSSVVIELRDFSGSNRFEISTNDVIWQPHIGLRVKSSDKIISPAVQLTHELAHAYLTHHNETYKEWVNTLKNISKVIDDLAADEIAYSSAASDFRTSETKRKEYEKKAYEARNKRLELERQSREINDAMENMVLEIYEKPISEELQNAGFVDEGKRENYDDVDEADPHPEVNDVTSTQTQTKWERFIDFITFWN